MTQQKHLDRIERTHIASSEDSEALGVVAHPLLNVPEANLGTLLLIGI